VLARVLVLALLVTARVPSIPSFSECQTCISSAATTRGDSIGVLHPIESNDNSATHVGNVNIKTTMLCVHIHVQSYDEFVFSVSDPQDVGCPYMLDPRHPEDTLFFIAESDYRFYPEDCV